MNNEQRDEILLEIHASSKVTEQVVKSQGETLTSLGKVVWGNGEPGVEKDVTLLKERQENCPARKATTTEGKRLNLALIAVVVSVIATIASIVFGVMK